MTHDPQALADIRALVSGMGLDESSRLLIERSYLESSPMLRRCLWLVADQKTLVLDCLLVPMTTWGASSSFAPLREYERMLRLSFWTCICTMPGGVIFSIFGKNKITLPRRWIWIHAGLCLLSSPLSLFLAWPIALGASQLAGSDFFLLVASAFFPGALGLFETRVLFKHYPKLNPARLVARHWLCPNPEEALHCAKLARESAASLGEVPTLTALASRLAPGSAMMLLHVPDFGIHTIERGAGDSATHHHAIALAYLSSVALGLALAGRDPAVDAALSVLADQEQACLADALAPTQDENSKPEPAPRRNRAL